MNEGRERTMARDIGIPPLPIPGGKPLYSNDVPIPGVPGRIHDTVVVDQDGNLGNPHLTWTPDGGKKQNRVHIWDKK
jgi:hypothetical protein